MTFPNDSMDHDGVHNYKDGRVFINYGSLCVR